MRLQQPIVRPPQATGDILRVLRLLFSQKFNVAVWQRALQNKTDFAIAPCCQIQCVTVM